MVFLQKERFRTGEHSAGSTIESGIYYRYLKGSQQWQLGMPKCGERSIDLQACTTSSPILSEDESHDQEQYASSDSFMSRGESCRMTCLPDTAEIIRERSKQCSCVGTHESISLGGSRGMFVDISHAMPSGRSSSTLCPSTRLELATGGKDAAGDLLVSADPEKHVPWSLTNKLTSSSHVHSEEFMKSPKCCSFVYSKQTGQMVESKKHPRDIGSSPLGRCAVADLNERPTPSTPAFLSLRSPQQQVVRIANRAETQRSPDFLGSLTMGSRNPQKGRLKRPYDAEFRRGSWNQAIGEESRKELIWSVHDKKTLMAPCETLITEPERKKLCSAELKSRLGDAYRPNWINKQAMSCTAARDEKAPDVSLELQLKIGRSFGESDMKAKLRTTIVLDSDEDDNATARDNEGLEMVDLLLNCATAIDNNEVTRGTKTLQEIYARASPQGDSMQRLAIYFADAISTRLRPIDRRRMLQPTNDQVLKSIVTLNKLSPEMQFAYFSANQAILEAVEGEPIVHIVDLTIRQGLQWPSFLQSLAARAGGAPKLVIITGVGEEEIELRKTGRHLRRFAAVSGIDLEFRAAICPAEKVADAIKRIISATTVGGALVVNCSFSLHRLLEETQTRLLRQIWRAQPRILAVVEEDAALNAPQFLGRCLEALQHYAALLDAIDSPPSLPRVATKAERLQAERVRVAAPLQNLVACEGTQRVQRQERPAIWKRRLEAIGFRAAKWSSTAVSQAEILLRHHWSRHHYSVRHHVDAGFLALQWRATSLISASTWHCPRSPNASC